MRRATKNPNSLAAGRKPTWEYVFPIVGLSAIFWEPGIGRDLWLVLGGMWLAIIGMYHCGWRIDERSEGENDDRG